LPVDGAREVAKLPADARPYVEPVLERLTEIAVEVPGAAAPTRAAVARALASYPRADWLVEADSYLHWRVHSPRGRRSDARDVVAQYRKWLRRAPAVLRRTPLPETAAASRDRASAATQRRIAEAFE
jgi:hypothetical protein